MVSRVTSSWARNLSNETEKPKNNNLDTELDSYSLTTPLAGGFRVILYACALLFSCYHTQVRWQWCWCRNNHRDNCKAEQTMIFRNSVGNKNKVYRTNTILWPKTPSSVHSQSQTELECQYFQCRKPVFLQPEKCRNHCSEILKMQLFCTTRTFGLCLWNTYLILLPQ